MSFDPQTAAQKVLATTDLTSPDDVAQAVFDMTPKRDISSVYRVLLRGVARDAMRLGRMGANDDAPRQVPQRSGKLVAIRDHHAVWLSQRVYALGDWKLLGDCSVDDLLDLAAQRRDVAARNSAHAERFELLARRLKDSGADVVRDLGEVAA